MVRTTYLSDQKHHDLAQFRHSARNAQSAGRCSKVTQSRREGNSKLPVLSPGNLDYHFLLYADKKGNIKCDFSSTIPHDERRKILQAAVPKYRDAVERITAKSTHPSFAIKAEPGGRTSYTGMHHHLKGDGPVPGSDYTAPTTQSVKRSKKRQRSSSEDTSSCLQDDHGSHVTERSDSVEVLQEENQSNLIGIQIQDVQKLKEYLFDAFTSFQQINCRTLCKSWIRTIEPKKQVNHPYNGNLKVKGVQKFPPNDLLTPKDSDPEETKPKWWPSKDDCPHKEPDHIKKEQRLALLCHILMNTGELHQCSTEDLKQAITSDRAKIKPAEKEIILEDVWKIGHQLERFRRGEIDSTSMVLVNARKEEARMIRGGGRSRKSLGAIEESQDEESSEGSEGRPDEVKTPRPPTPPAFATCVQYLSTDQASIVSQVRLDERGYAGNPSAHHFLSPETKGEYLDHQAEYPMSVEVNPTLDGIAHHGSSGHVFNPEIFPENSYGSMQDTRSHAVLFSPDEQQFIGQWAISATPDLYPMHYTGEPSQPPAINVPDGDHIFGPYPYASPHKPPYRDNVHGYPADGQAHFPAGYDADMARFQRTNTCSFPPQSTQRLHSPSMVPLHSYDLPSHIRA